MMPYTRAERKRVYLDWKVIFSSFNNTHLRKTKAIQAVVQRHRPHCEIFEPKTVGILQSLLKEGIFEYCHDAKAREVFPELFEAVSTKTSKETARFPVAAEVMLKTGHQSESQNRLLSSLEQ
jgi:hypothetical protein